MLIIHVLQLAHEDDTWSVFSDFKVWYKFHRVIAAFYAVYWYNWPCCNNIGRRLDCTPFPQVSNWLIMPWAKWPPFLADDMFKCIFFNQNVWISLNISLQFSHKGSINNIPGLVQIMAWHQPDDKPLSEPMMLSLLTFICVTRPQWVKKQYWSLLV